MLRIHSHSNKRDEVQTKIKDIPIVKEYLDVLPEDISTLPLDREVEFTIDVLPRITPIFKASYRMAPAEMKELKVQLRELLNKKNY